MKLKTQKIVVNSVDRLLKKHIDTACWYIFYQPSTPKKVAKKYQ